MVELSGLRAWRGVLAQFPGVLQQLWMMPARRPRLLKCVESRRCCDRGEKRRKRSDMEPPFDRWSTRRTEDFAVKAPSCCETW